MDAKQFILMIKDKNQNDLKKNAIQVFVRISQRIHNAFTKFFL